MMGWFWADSSTSSTPPRPATIPPHSAQNSNTTPPPSCPMNKDRPSPLLPKSTESSCPIKTPKDSLPQHETSSSTLSKLNPLNYMPSNLSQSRAPNQTVDLPVDREESTIPRGDSDSNWEYPSPQQMYNAMLRKGYDDTPQDAVESMVAVHNFLNEGAWAEIVGWENRFSRGLGQGWNHCQNGEEGFDTEMVSRELGKEEEPRLIRFQGRPRDMTPKAKIFQMLGQVYPTKFRSEPPFDRHDWFVQRRMPGGQQREVRYVIDYYSGPPEPTGEPVFYLDVRPAVDGPTAAAERLIRWGRDTWYTASGASARQGRE